MAATPIGMIEGDDLLAMRGDERQRLLGAVFLHRDRRLGVDRVGRILRASCRRHTCGTRRRSACPTRRCCRPRIVYSTPIRSKMRLISRSVADRIAVEAADEVDLLVRLTLELGRRAGLAVPEMLDDALHHIVVAGDVAADEGRRVGERNVEFCRHRALLLGGLDEGVEVVADHFRHAGRRDRDHLRLVHGVGVGEPVDHVVEAAEHRRVFGHRGGDAGARLLEVPREVAAIIGDAALRAVHEGQRALEADGREHRAQAAGRLWPD